MSTFMSRLGAILIALISFSINPIHKSLPINHKKYVAWDIHGVLCTHPKKHGWNCKPIEEVFAIVKDLHQQGIPQVIFSNISRESYAKLSCRFPQHFQYFIPARSMTEGGGLHKRSLTSDGFLFRKPHTIYYKTFLKKNNDIRPDQFIFFDDKPENIQKAKQMGIYAYQFTTAQQARTILQNKNLL